MRNNVDSDTGLVSGYSKEEWVPWKSHALLLQRAIDELGWVKTAAGLYERFKAFSKESSGHLNEGEFTNLLVSLGCCDAAHIPHFFRLFDRNQDGLINDVDFLSGVLAVSPSTPHEYSKACGQLRLQYIFLFYDTNKNGRLDVDESRVLVEHLGQLSGSSDPESAQFAKTVDEALRTIFVGASMSFNSFYSTVTSKPLAHHWLGRLDAVLRMTSDPVALGAENKSEPARVPLKPKKAGAGNEVTDSNSRTANERAGLVRSKAPVPKQVDENQSVSINQFQPAIGGSFSRKNGAPSGSAGVLVGPTGAPTGSTASPVTLKALRGQEKSLISERSLMDYTYSSISDSVVSRAVQMAKGTTESSSLGGRTEITYSRLLRTAEEAIHLCEAALQCFKAEDSLVTTEFPCRVYGDIHGQLADLVTFFEMYNWPSGKKGDLLSMNYVFLGDYVDRGQYSVDVIALLFALKVASWSNRDPKSSALPSRLILLRGNHEDRAMNSAFGFRKECAAYFGEADGEKVWEAFNTAFEYMPLSCLIGGEVLCLHGGIGESIDSVDDLVGIEKPIVVPSEGQDFNSLGSVDKVVLDALWSDPVQMPSSGVGTMQGVPVSLRHGVDKASLGDPERSDLDRSELRGMTTSSFSASRVKEFCDHNGVRLILRAHECVPQGYEYFADGLLLTVFSAPNYCGFMRNDAACIVLIRKPDGTLEEHAQILKGVSKDGRASSMVMMPFAADGAPLSKAGGAGTGIGAGLSGVNENQANPGQGSGLMFPNSGNFQSGGLAPIGYDQSNYQPVRSHVSGTSSAACQSAAPVYQPSTQAYGSVSQSAQNPQSVSVSQPPAVSQPAVSPFGPRFNARGQYIPQPQPAPSQSSNGAYGQPSYGQAQQPGYQQQPSLYSQPGVYAQSSLNAQPSLFQQPSPYHQHPGYGIYQNPGLFQHQVPTFQHQVPTFQQTSKSPAMMVQSAGQPF